MSAEATTADIPRTPAGICPECGGELVGTYGLWSRGWGTLVVCGWHSHPDDRRPSQDPKCEFVRFDAEVAA